MFCTDQEGLPDYWGIETFENDDDRVMIGRIRKDYPTTGVLKRRASRFRMPGDCRNQEGLPDYWGIETRHSGRNSRRSDANQEGLPDYWGIETSRRKSASWLLTCIRKDYPTTGVLKLFLS